MLSVNNLLGQRLKTLRGTRSLYDVEKGCGIHRSRISRYERGLLVPKLPTLKTFAEFYDIDLQELMELNFETLYPIGSEQRGYLLKWANKT